MDRRMFDISEFYRTSGTVSEEPLRDAYEYRKQRRLRRPAYNGVY